MEAEKDIPYFGRVFLFSMDCESCGYHKADVEPAEQKEPTKHTVEISTEDDMSIRIIKSSSATIKIPHITTIEPGPASNGYVTNIEGVLNRVKNQLQGFKKDDEDKSVRDKAKRMLKKIDRVMWGKEKLKMSIEDPQGNSAIISEKAVVKKL